MFAHNGMTIKQNPVDTIKTYEVSHQEVFYRGIGEYWRSRDTAGSAIDVAQS